MNPELQRNLWSEITLHRLLAMPVVILLVLSAAAAIDSNEATERVALTAMGGFALITLFWGTRQAAAAVTNEVLDKTWDWQRLSTLTPWQMTWGKLVGATVFTWYGSAICLGVYLAMSTATGYRAPAITALTAVLLGIMLQAASLTSALHMMRKGLTANRRAAGLLVMLLALYFVPFIFYANGARADVKWYRGQFPAHPFYLASAMVFSAWAVVGAWRAMCQNLAVRTTPIAWFGFLCTSAAYAAGFVVAEPDSPSLSISLLSSFVATGLAGTYLMAFTEPTGPLVFHRIARLASRGQWRRVAEESPCWPLGWLLAAACALALLALPMEAGLRALPIALMLTAARDVALLIFFLSTAKPQRAEGTTMVYLVLADLIVPGLLRSLDMNVMAGIVFPPVAEQPWLQVTAALTQAVIVGVFAWRRLRKTLNDMKRADGA